MVVKWGFVIVIHFDSEYTTVSCNIFSNFFLTWNALKLLVPTNLKTSPPGQMFFKHIHGSTEHYVLVLEIKE